MSLLPKQKSKPTSRILVVDDDPVFRQLMCNKLASLDYATLEAEDGAAAWSILLAQPLRLLIVDLEMPNLDGFELIEGIRARPKLQQLPIIVVTSRTDQPAINRIFEAGATSYLVKPVHWPTLGSHVQCVLRVTDKANQERSRRQQSESQSALRAAMLTSTIAKGVERMAAISAEASRLRDRSPDQPPSNDTLATFARLADQASAAEAELRRMHLMLLGVATPDQDTEKLAPLNSMLAALLNRIAPLSRQRNVPACVARCPEGVFISCNPDALVDAISRVVSNAIAFSAPGQSVVIDIDAHPDGMLTMSVADDGLGMVQDVYANCLGALRGEDLAAELAGTQAEGIETVKAAIDGIGGAVTVTSKPRRGTTVVIAIPGHRVRVEAERVA